MLVLALKSKAHRWIGIDIPPPMSGVRLGIEDRQQVGVTGHFGSRTLRIRTGDKYGDHIQQT